MVKTRKATARKVPDFNRLRAAIAGPGADTRAWMALARVEEAEGSVTWMEGTGWVVDVTFVSGARVGEGDIACRVGGPIGGNGTAQSCPIEPGMVVVVAITDGDLNVQPVIVGTLHNPTDQAVPTTVNELAIDESVALSTNLTVSDYPDEEQYSGDVRIQATGAWFIVAPTVNIAPNDVRGSSNESFVRGNEFGDALGDFLDGIGNTTGLIITALNIVQPAIAGAPVVGVPLSTWFTSLAGALALLGGGPAGPALPTGIPFAASSAGVFKATIAQADLGGWLSDRIKGE